MEIRFSTLRGVAWTKSAYQENTIMKIWEDTFPEQNCVNVTVQNHAFSPIKLMFQDVFNVV